MKWSEMRNMTDASLKDELARTVEEIRNLRFQAGVGPLENPLLLRHARRKVARIQTLLGERSRAEAPAAQEQP
ncbi:MAG: 50S ribosomal protein L29 [Candidatus Lindowbacteria bacterium RIFCSPLOWO2_12_FULL_62_27]|nr:MAG: 50S ribosomal protein L29 [Candidatus Lindowbacteria bacterium RIFCSPLOWO2_12_FULL_62_27]